MIVIGSYALAVAGHCPMDTVRDIDVVGVKGDVARFRDINADIIDHERAEHDHRHVFYLKPGAPVERVEFDFEQSASDRMLPGLCHAKADVMGITMGVPPIEVLYLLKRAHANVPIHFDKALRDILRLKPLIGDFSEAQTAFYRARKHECGDRYALHRQRFSLAIKNADFFDTSNHVRFYEHDDLHRAVAHDPGKPLFARCKHDPSLAKIDIDLFEALGPRDRLRMVQEEFMVIGIERFFLNDRSLGSAECYRLGMNKTIRDLFVGYFQDFCIDHVDLLQAPPPYDFVGRFEAAVARGQVQEVQIEIGPPNERHDHIRDLILKGDLETARRLSEDMARKADRGIDPHAFYLLGVTLFKSNKMEPAVKCLRWALGRDRKNAEAWLYLGTALRRLGAHAEAVDAFQRAGALGVAGVELLWNLGASLEALSRTEEAADAYRRAYQLRPEPALAARLEALGTAAAKSLVQLR